MKGSISIGKVTTNNEAEPHYVRLEVTTDEYKVTVKLGMFDFAHLIFGQIMPCEVSLKLFAKTEKGQGA